MLEEKRVVEKVKGMINMRKVYVDELSQSSQKLFIALANELKIDEEDIEQGLLCKIDDLQETEIGFGFRSCNNLECREFFTEGYYMEELSECYCSRECAEKNHDDIVNNDYGTDTIFYTEWVAE